MTTIQTATGPEQTMVLNMGPQHPSTHGVLRVLLELDGEIIVKADVEIGYLHTEAFMKTAENQPIRRPITITDGMDYLAPLSNNLAYCLAVEKLLGLEVPEAQQRYPRAASTELTSIGLVASGLARQRMRFDLWRDVRFPLLFPRTRRIAENFRDGQRPAHDDELLPHWWPCPRAAGRAGLTAFRISCEPFLPVSMSTRNC